MPWSSASLEQGSKAGASDWVLLGLLQGIVRVEELMECREDFGSLFGKLTGGSVGTN